MVSFQNVLSSEERILLLQHRDCCHVVKLGNMLYPFSKFFRLCCGEHMLSLATVLSDDEVQSYGIEKYSGFRFSLLLFTFSRIGI